MPKNAHCGAPEHTLQSGTNVAPGNADPVCRLLSQLEQSLASSEHALLARDLAAIEEGTAEQARLLALLELRSSEPVLSAQRILLAQRVLDRGRVQLVLLARAQRSSRIIANLVAGSQAGYICTPRGPRAAEATVVG